jgi:hypothetical protein
VIEAGAGADVWERSRVAGRVSGDDSSAAPAPTLIRYPSAFDGDARGSRVLHGSIETEAGTGSSREPAGSIPREPDHPLSVVEEEPASE